MATLFDQSLVDHSAAEHVGVVSRIRNRWDNADGSATVLVELRDGETMRGRLEAGEQLTAGDHALFLGQWLEHPRFGWQMAFTSYLKEVPANTPDLIDYLARHCPGIGPVTARQVVEHYGMGSVQLLCDDPERLVRDGLLDEDQARAASEALAALCDPQLRSAHLRLHGLLKGHGFWGKATRQALRLWGARAPDVVCRDPFRMLTEGLAGCGFTRCDRLWQHLGLPMDRLKRQAMAAWYALDRLDGHTWAPLGEALSSVRSRIGQRPRERRALALLCRAGLAELRLEEDGRIWVGERDKVMAERQLALDVRRLMAGSCRWPAVERRGEPFPPGPFDAASEHQLEQLRAALSSPVAILTGAPGTGKTWCAAAVIAALRDTGASQVSVCAPTGKAAVRITQKMRDANIGLTATTIHKLVGSGLADDGRMTYHSSAIDVRWLVLDEASMCDTTLLCALFRVLPTGCHVLIVGDVHQLPPVGHGAPLRDLMAAGVPTARLSEVRRNAGAIVTACHQIKDGQVPQVAGDLAAWTDQGEQQHANLVLLPPAKEGGRASPALLCKQLDGLYEWLVQRGMPLLQASPSLRDGVQVICARNATRQALNQHLQQALNPDGEHGPGRFRVGDKVICLKNSQLASVKDGRVTEARELVANGDQGWIERFRDKSMFVRLACPDRHVSVYLGREAEEERPTGLDDEEERGTPSSWDLAYAITTHKSQGSEWPVAIVIVETGRLGCRELIYTAISRARELCVLIGDRADLAKCVARTTLPDRKTCLVELLRSES